MPNFVLTKTDPDKLKVTANNIFESIVLVRRAFSAIEMLLNKSSGSLFYTWKGPASEQFFAQYTIDQQLFMNLLIYLESINERLKEAAGIFDNADVKALELVKQLKIG